jgi:glutathionyl-hydroquinone reductase
MMWQGLYVSIRIMKRAADDDAEGDSVKGAASNNKASFHDPSQTKLSGVVTEQETLANKDTTEGAVHRPPTKFHHKIGGEDFPAEAGRYRLYVSPACPWAHRCWLTVKLKGLEDVVSVTLTGDRLANISFEPPYDAYYGWDFTEESAEPHGFTFIDQLYEHACPGYRRSYEDNGQRPCYSVPVLSTK